MWHVISRLKKTNSPADARRDASSPNRVLRLHNRHPFTLLDIRRCTKRRGSFTHSPIVVTGTFSYPNFSYIARAFVFHLFTESVIANPGPYTSRPYASASSMSAVPIPRRRYFTSTSTVEITIVRSLARHSARLPARGAALALALAVGDFRARSIASNRTMSFVPFIDRSIVTVSIASDRSIDCLVIHQKATKNDARLHSSPSSESIDRIVNDHDRVVITFVNSRNKTTIIVL